MFLEGLFSLLSNIIFFTSKIDNDNCFPSPLSKEKEKEYIEKYKNGDLAARDVLIKHNLRLVAYIAKKYTNYSDRDELVSIGSLGLVKAISSYKPESGTALATYASRCIENEILMAMRANKKTLCNVSLYDSVGTDKDGNEMTFLDMLSIDEEELFAKADKKILSEKISRLIDNSLTDREKRVIIERFGFGDGVERSQQTIAEELGISRSYVSRIEKKAVAKLRTELLRSDFRL